MTFGFTTEQKLLRESVRKLMRTHANRDYVRRKDAKKAYPYELYDEWVEAGLLGVAFPEKYGGSGGSVIDLAICAEEIAYISADFQMCFGGSMFCGLTLLDKGSEEQKQLLAAEDHQRRAPLLDLDVGAGCRLRRRRDPHARGPERLRLGDQRPEAVEYRRRRPRQYDQRLSEDRHYRCITARACRCSWSTTTCPASS